MHLADERRHYIVTSSLIGRAHTKGSLHNTFGYINQISLHFKHMWLRTNYLPETQLTIPWWHWHMVSLNLINTDSGNLLAASIKPLSKPMQTHSSLNMITIINICILDSPYTCAHNTFIIKAIYK